MQRPFDLERFLSDALAEDIGDGDITTNAVIPASAKAKFAFVARQPLVVAGLAFLPMLFGMIDSEAQVVIKAEEGAKVDKGAQIATISGPARALLMGERTALNLLQQLSGVATLTRQYVDKIEGTGAHVIDTRKTIPGLRFLQKYAVRMGGGHNHRMGLYDAVLIKDNHLAMAGSVKKAVELARADVPKQVKIEVECDTLKQVDEAIAAKADIVLLDNMDLKTLKEAVKKAKAANITTEASGNVNLETIRTIAETGVDLISIGRLTHSAPAVDIGLDSLD